MQSSLGGAKHAKLQLPGQKRCRIVVKIAYVEDIPEHREMVLRKIQDWIRVKSPTSSVTVFQDAQSFLFALEDELFDLLLLDIVMPGMDGVSLARALRSRGNDAMIVFITGEKDFVFDGYKVAAMDYLLKPIRDDELMQVLDRALSKHETTVPEVVLETDQGLEGVRVDRIAAIEVQNKALLFTVLDKGRRYRTIRMRGSLSEWMDTLTELGWADRFLQVHRSYVCHVAHVKRLDDDTVELHNGTKLPLARSRKKDVFRQYMDYRKSVACDKSRGGRP